MKTAQVARARAVAPDRVFCGVYPCGLVFADRHRESHGDYKRLAFLSYHTLKLEFEPDAPAHLREVIEKDVAAMNLKPGATFQISTCGQTVRLGGAGHEIELGQSGQEIGAGVSL